MPASGGTSGRLRDFVRARLVLRGTGDPEVDLLLGAVGVAALLGWVSIAAVLLGLATGLPVEHPEVVLATTAIAAIGHAGLGLLPWPRLLATPRGRQLLALWQAALIAGTVGLVLTAGGSSRLDLLFFLAAPWLASVEQGWRRAAWLALAAAGFLASALLAPSPLPAPEIVLHAVLVIGAAILGALLSSTARRQARGRAAAIRRAELEGAMLAEGHHRVKNSLAVVADLLLLGRPDDPTAARTFDQAETRIRAVAAVHDVLATRSGGRVPADELLAAVVAAAGPAGTELQVASVPLTFQQAQHVGVIVNELVTNAHRHGQPPVQVTLVEQEPGALQLTVRDAGPGPQGDAAERRGGLGLRLVQQVTEQGLGGRLELVVGGATVWFRIESDAHPRR